MDHHQDSLNNARGNFISSKHLDERLSASLSHVPPDARNILDIACGEGYFLRMLLEKRDIEAHGIDISEANVEFAKKNAPKASFSVRDAIRTQYPASNFDCVSMLEVIDHFDKPKLALKEVNRVLRKGGVLVVSFPEPNLRWRCVWWLWTRTLGKKWRGEHKRVFRREDFFKILDKAGFEILKKEAVFFGMINIISARKR